MRPKIYLFGDSITEFSLQDGGWGASLANLYSRKADLMIRGYGAYNTRWSTVVLTKGKVFPPPGRGDGEPLAVVVFFGANDACLPDSRGWGSILHVPLVEYKQNLHQIIAYVRERWPTVTVVVITPPPIDEARLLLEQSYKGRSLTRTNETTGKYAKACLEVAAECGVPAVDLWSKFQQSSGWEKTFLCDGLHLTPAGNMLVFEEVAKKLKEAGISPEMLPFDLPHYSEFETPNDALQVFENLSSSSCTVHNQNV